MNNTVKSPLIQHTKPLWLPVFSMLLTLYGILFLGWNLQPIIVVFWWEVILMIGSALVRMIFAMDNRPFLETLFPKVFMLIGGVIMGGAFVMFSVVFTFKVFDGNFSSNGFEKIPNQINMLKIGYLVSLVIHYFMNGRYKTANPMGEMASVFIHLLILLAFLQALTMHLIPKYPQLNQAMWVAIALVVLKFIVDMLFSKINKPFKKVFENNKLEME